MLLDVHVPTAAAHQCDVPTRLLSAKLRYLSAAATASSARAAAPSLVKASGRLIRPSGKLPASKPPPAPPPWLELHKCRVAAVHAIMRAHKVAERGDVHRARAMLSETTDLIRSTSCAPTGALQQLLADMRFVSAGYSDGLAFRDVGRQRSFSTAMAHMQQRSSHTAGAAYERSFKAHLKSAWSTAANPSGAHARERSSPANCSQPI